MNTTSHQKNIVKSAVYRLLIVSIFSYGFCAVFFYIYPTQFAIDSLQPAITSLLCLLLLLYFHQKPLTRIRKTTNIYTAITLLTFTPATFYFTHGAWQGDIRFIESYPPISGMIVLTSTLVMLMLPKKYAKLAALIWALNALPVLHYLFTHPEELHTTRGYDLLFIFGPASLLIFVIIPYQQSMREQMEKISYDLTRYKLHADRDFLTDTLNRRGLDSWLTRNHQLESMGLLLIDVDYFKNINDRFGHSTGDHVLVEIASRLRTVYHDNHCLARWGGEEFILVVANPAPAALNKLAADCHTVFRHIPFRTVGKVTTSIGVSRIAGAQDFDRLIEEADQALYHAKENGRDQVVMFSEMQPQLSEKMKRLMMLD